MSLSMPSVQVRMAPMLEERQRRSQSGRGREKDLEGGALAGLTLRADGAPMFQDDTPRDGQAQAGAMRFGGEKRLEQVGHISRENAVARVLDRNPEVGLVYGV